MRRVLALTILTLAAAPAAAQVPTQRITTSGPIASYVIGNDLTCQMTVAGDPFPSYEPQGVEPGYCATYVAVTSPGGQRTLYGPDPAQHPGVPLPTPDVVYTPTPGFTNGQQVNPISTNPGDGAIVTSHVDLGASGLRVSQDDYAFPSSGNQVGSNFTVDNPRDEDAQITVYRFVQCYLQRDSTGDFGFRDFFGSEPTSGYSRPGCTSQLGLTPARAEWLFLFDTTSHSVVTRPAGVAALMRAGDLPDTCVCGEDADLVLGVSAAGTATARSTYGVGWTAYSGPAEAGQNGQPPAPAPQQTGNVQPIDGIVKVRVPGTNTFVPLDQVKSIPVGTIIDTTKGVVALNAASSLTGGKTQTGRFNGGRFKFGQSMRRIGGKGPKRLVTDLTLNGGNFGSCKSRAATGYAAKRRIIRYIKAKARGRFRVKGRYSSGVERGTTWTTSDGCDGTLTKVTEGVVLVTDEVRNKIIRVRAGRSYLARARRG